MAEWEYAARGTDGRRYPWGEAWDPAKANGTRTTTTPVGSYPNGANPFGVHDMAGNVTEWMSTLSFRDSYLAGDGRENLKGIGPSVLRGGAWNAGPWDLRAAARSTAAYRDYRNGGIGFRCAQGVP